MRLWPRALSVRLAVMFALVSALLLGSIGFYLYQSLQREIAWRDDQALLGRLERMQALLDDSESIDTLRSRPQLYENMLGNRDSLLWIVDDAGQRLIEINPALLPLPVLPAAAQATLGDSQGSEPLRLAWLDVSRGDRRLTLIAGKLLSEREQMLAAYRLKLWLALSVGALLAFALGWLVSQRGLRPVRQLATRAAAIDVQHLHLRLDEFKDVSELQALSQALNQMLARLEDGFAQLSRFSEDLAHEMRTPLARLRARLERARREAEADPSARGAVAAFDDAVAETAELIAVFSALLDIARTEAATGDAGALVEVDLAEVIATVVDLYEGVAEERGVRLLVDAVPAVTLGEPMALTRMFANLVDNAVKFSPDGADVDLGVAVGPGEIRLWVRDHGPGLPPGFETSAFERFTRADNAGAVPGHGLGLPFVRAVALRHGMRIALERADPGLRVVLRIPRPSP